MNFCRYKRKIAKSMRSIFFRGSDREISINELENLKKSGAVVIDIRSSQEYSEYHIDGAINIPLYELNCNIKKYIQDKNKTIIVYCQSGVRSRKALLLLNSLGYNNVYELEGGIDGI